MDKIIIRGAREHNLKNVDVTLPRDKFIVMTGLSGSGKSSLAFDTIYADGQRRYIESLSSYARMFLGQMEKPDVDSIEGLSPAISIDQKTTSKNPRSTVGTVTEIYDYLRLLFARTGVPHCTVCGREISMQTVDQIVDRVMELKHGQRVQILAPIVRSSKGQFKKELAGVRKQGFVRVRVNGSVYDLSEEIKLDKNKKHDIEVVVDRLVIKPEIVSRLSESVETAGKLTGGTIMVEVMPSGKEADGDGEILHFSQNYACPEHGSGIEELEPRLFSFNNPMGACPDCTGLGYVSKVDPDMLIPDTCLSLRQGAVHAKGWGCDYGSISEMYFSALAKKYKFKLDTPVEKLPVDVLAKILYGTGDDKIVIEASYAGERAVSFEGVIPNMERRYRETTSTAARDDIRSYMNDLPCPACHGNRLCPEVLSVTIGGNSNDNSHEVNISDCCKMSVGDALEYTSKIQLSQRSQVIAAPIMKEIRTRLGFLNSVGLSYLTLSRSAATLSGGESQRIRLATQIGSSLTGVLYVLDEPSIGLHQRDNNRLIDTLKKLRDLGNTLIVVEHDEDTMRAADYIVDIGPGAGTGGGEILCAGKLSDILKCPKSITGQYLSGVKKIPVPPARRKPLKDKWLVVKGAAENNLKNIDVKIPLGLFTCVTGVSGSGKSSLVNEIIYKYLVHKLNRAHPSHGKFGSIEGLQHLDKIIDIDQSPIGRTPRSNPATYTGVFTDIRDLFAGTQTAKLKGYEAGRFSFNIKGGRCEACQGDGVCKIEMHFLPDVYVPCEVCKGKRYNRETLEVKWNDKSIYDVLEMTVTDGLEFFKSMPKIHRRLKTLEDVGLGYVKIGQPATTLSGGEAQRVKLAAELSKRATGRTIYVLDEPTTGLHAADVHKLIEVLYKLTLPTTISTADGDVELSSDAGILARGGDFLQQGGNTVLVIEHNLDLIKTADYIIDLGPEGGDGGGTVVCCGTPEEVAACEKSYTGQFLKPYLKDKNKG